MQDPKDAIREKLVALLYGELPEGEARTLRLLLDRDPEMRAEWEEISGARSVLQQWEVREMTPRLVFVNQRPVPLPPRTVRRGFRWDWLRRGIASPAWGVAAAAAVVAVLALSGFRVERGDHTVAFRFGRPAPAPVVAANDQYVTRQELDHQVRTMGEAVVSYLDEYSRGQEESNAVLLRTALSEENSRHVQDYRDLRGRIEDIGLGMRQDHALTRAQLDYLWRQSHEASPDTLRGGAPAPINGGEHE